MHWSLFFSFQLDVKVLMLVVSLASWFSMVCSLHSTFFWMTSGCIDSDCKTSNSHLYARYHKYFQCGGAVIIREPAFSHQLQNMCDPYTSCQFHAYSHIHNYFVVFLGCESRLVTQFL